MGTDLRGLRLLLATHFMATGLSKNISCRAGSLQQRYLQDGLPLSMDHFACLQIAAMQLVHGLQEPQS